MKIFVDFDDTLASRARFFHDVYGEFADVSAEDLRKLYSEYRVTEEFTLPGFSKFLTERGLDGAKLEKILFTYQKRMNEYIALDAVEFLGALKSKGHELTLLTRSAEPETWQKPKVMASGLAHLFDAIEISKEKKVDVVKRLGVNAPFVFIDDKEVETQPMMEAFPSALCIKHVPDASLMDHLPEIDAYVALITSQSGVSIVERDGVAMPELPLPLHSSTVIADCVLVDGEELTITLGLNQTGVDAFKKRSCDESDEELMKFTSDHERICLGSYEAWYAKERYPFALMKGSELAGLIWFGPKEFPSVVGHTAPETTKPWHTFAIRTYMPYRGKRLAFPFSHFVFRMFDYLFPGSPVWLDTDKENAGAVKLYTKLGFKEYGQTESGRLVMVRM